MAYVLTRCHEEHGGSGYAGSQALWVRRGDRLPVKIAEFAGGHPPIGGLCALFGRSRAGSFASPLAGAFQRLGVSPDGSRVIFEVTDAFSIFTRELPEEQQGIFVVRADGAGLRRIAHPSRDSLIRADYGCVLAGGGCVSASGDFAFSPDGRRVVYTDLGPSRAGDEAPQIFTLDLASGERQQVTRLPLLPLCNGQSNDSSDCVEAYVVPVSLPSFLDDTTIAYLRGRGDSFLGGGLFTVVETGGTWGEPELAPVVALPGGGVVPVPEITGAQPSSTTNVVPGVPENEPCGSGDVIRETFVIESVGTAQGREPRVLQLTNYGRCDTGGSQMGADRQHVFFDASADPLGSNPSLECQWFSVDRLGGDLRQLTTFGSADVPGCNCSVVCNPPRCTVSQNGHVDRITGSMVFAATCDPFGTNPHDGEQIFALPISPSIASRRSPTRPVRCSSGGRSWSAACSIR